VGNPVVHFELIHKDSEKVMQFYRDAFGWDIDSDNPMNYGTVLTKDGDQGIDGGIGPTQDPTQPGYLIVYAQVPDINAQLKKVEELGGKTVMPRTEIPNVVTFAQFTDPFGHLFGLVEPQ
jgi:uncharacterized protein